MDPPFSHRADASTETPAPKRQQIGSAFSEEFRGPLLEPSGGRWLLVLPETSEKAKLQAAWSFGFCGGFLWTTQRLQFDVWKGPDFYRPGVETGL